MLIPFGVFSAAGASGGGGGGAAYELISTAYGTGSSGVIDFTSIPSTYKHLQVRLTVQSATTAADVLLQFNNSTSSIYSYHMLYGQGSSVTSTGYGSQSAIYLENIMAYNTESSQVGEAVIDVLDYASTTKNKTVRTLFGRTTSSGSSKSVALVSGSWQSTSAITSVKLTAGDGNFSTISRFSLYGIKGA